MLKPRICINNFLANLPLFRNSEGEQLARLARGTSELEVPRGTVVFHRGDPCNGLHIVIYGQVKLSLQTSRGDEKVVELIGRGMSFGEPAMFVGKPHIVTAEALVDSKLLHIAKEVVLEEVGRDARFSRLLIENLSDRLYRQIADLEDYFLHSGTERVVSFLLHTVNGSAVDNVAQITLPAKKGIIASRLNLTHEHFSRILHDLIDAGLIQVEGRDVRILDTQRLFGYSG